MSKIIIVIKNKPRIICVYGIDGYIYHHDHFRYFFAKREITFEVATFGGSLLSGFANTCEISSLLSGGRFFLNFTVSG